MRSLCLTLLFAVTPALAWAAEDKADLPVGTLPRGADGKPLNLDFEAGDLRDWTADGKAFEKQPVKGDVVFERRDDMRSEHAGEYWVGTYEIGGDVVQGTLSSKPFKVTHPFAAFLIGGGSLDSTRVELCRAENGRSFYKTSANNTENMHRVVVDLTLMQGKEIFIRLVDQSNGGWGHINFDDFKFYETKPKFPGGPSQPADLLEFAGLSPDEAARAMTLPEGFRATAFAGEPDVRQPIAMTIDDRGRLWVAEAFEYPFRAKKDENARDRILIFEDADNDGRFDKRTVFAENLNLVSGLEVGFGGVWVGAAPYLLFIPDRDGDDQPDGKPEILLDGWAYEDTHETLNSFIWGPDGWLYGCHGVFTHSKVGKPGTAKEDREPINAGIWRYHPTRQEFEVFAWGTSNPWGVDFNDYGDTFLSCCVIPHLFHIIQGARYQRQAGEHFQPYTYADIQTIAKHRHWVGNQWNEADRAKSDAQGGGHAHAGAMIYLGGRWPGEYRNQLFMNNIHGARLNVDQLSASRSGYLGDGTPDFCKTNDLWSQMLYLRSGPDGNVYVIDWYDRNQCHHHEINGHDRSNGRIFKISYGDRQPATAPLRTRSDKELVALQLSDNDWLVRTSRRLLQERALAGQLDRATPAGLEKIAFKHEDTTRRLRGLWALHLTAGLSEAQVLAALNDHDAHVRGWAIQLALENGKPGAKLLDALMTMARGDESPIVRRFIASGLLRIPEEQRWDILVGLLGQSADADDHNLPLQYWYAAEPLAAVDTDRALELAASGNIPLVHEFMIRRIGAIGTPAALELLVKQADRAADHDARLVYLRGMQLALKGRRQVPMPGNWQALVAKLGDSESSDLRTVAFSLSVTFGDPASLLKVRQLVASSDTPLEQRKDYLATLLAARDGKLVPVLHDLMKVAELRSAAIRGLAAYDDADTPALLLKAYPGLPTAEKRDTLATLTSRLSYGKALLTAIGEKKIQATDLTADLVRQLRNLKDDALDEQIVAVWGVVRDSPEDKASLIADYKKLLTTHPAGEELHPLGRAVFAKICQQCHTLFGTGGKIGPELTGSNRANLDYLLANVLDPSAVMSREYIPNVIVTTEGRVLTGLVREGTKNSVTIVTANETLVIPREEIDEMVKGDKSMMPDDLLKPLKEDEVRALVAYLASQRQVPLLATGENVVTFFNGQNLEGWDGNTDLWRVENGEIVGTSTGLERNEFLVNNLLLGDFRLSLEVKLTPNEGNSGIQFRSEALPGGEVKGYQADIGVGWWGKLYEENGRALLWKDSGEAHVKTGDWNRYEIVANGSRVRTYINGKPCVNLDDPDGAARGVIALQLHSGGAFEVRFRNLKLELDPQVAAK